MVEAVSVAGVGGRRWQVVCYFEHTPVGEDLDRIHMMCSGNVCSQVFERSSEYRHLWDEARQLWRMDRRIHVPGG